MRAEEEDAGILIEDILRAVAMVYVPVNDQYAVDAVDLARMASGEGHVVEDAEAHAARGRGVVAGGRTAAKALDTWPSITASTAAKAAPTASMATSSDFSHRPVSPVLRAGECRAMSCLTVER